MKTYKITMYRWLYSHLYFEGTLSELTEKFSYTLLCGNQQNGKIPTKPKTIKSLVKALNDSCRATGRNNDFYYLDN